MSWLLHKFAQASQNGILLASLIVSGGLGGGTGLYDFLTEDPDNIAGANRDGIVKVFEGEIADLKNIQTEYDGLVAERTKATIKDDTTEISKLSTQVQENKAHMDDVAYRIKRELHLVPSISENDYINLSESYNENFPLGDNRINIEGGAFLHDAQENLDMDQTGNMRDTLYSTISGSMKTFAENEGDINPEHPSDERVLFTALAALGGAVIGGLLTIPFNESKNLKRISKQPSPKSPLSEWQEKNARIRERKKRQQNKLN